MSRFSLLLVGKLVYQAGGGFLFGVALGLATVVQVLDMASRGVL
jgi:hypothetical protein